MPIQLRIAQLLIDAATAAAHPLLSMIADKDPHEVCLVIFKNFRGSGKGMRLTDEGLQLMKTFFKCHDVALIPGYKEHLPHLLYLDRIAKMPYWINAKYFASFDSELAMMLTLASGDLATLVESRFRLTAGGTQFTPE